jgi:hypothetical protein
LCERCHTDVGNSGCFSFESRDSPGSYIRHYNFAPVLASNDGSKQFHENATFCPQAGLSGQGTTSVRSWNHPTRHLQHYNDVVYVASHSSVDTFDAPRSYMTM